jgi:hypothetical protein
MKVKCLQWKGPTSQRAKKTRMSKSQIKTVLNTIYDIKDNVHYAFIPKGQALKHSNRLFTGM